MDLFDDLLSDTEPAVEELLPRHSAVSNGPIKHHENNDSSAVLHRNVFKDKTCNRLFFELFDDVDWQQREVIVYGKKHLQPRLIAWFGDPNTPYTYAGLTLQPMPWTSSILEIKTICEALTGTVFNSVLLNLYRNGEDTVGWHSDDELELGINPTIASVSFGATRRFDLRHKNTKQTVKVALASGYVLIMKGRTQTEWSHQIPRTKKVKAPRINLTFRQVCH